MEMHSLIEQARDLDEPTQEEHERVRRALGVTIASVAAITAAGTAAKVTASQVATGGGAATVGMGTFGLTSKFILWTSAGLVTSALGWGALRLADSREPDPTALVSAGVGNQSEGKDGHQGQNLDRTDSTPLPAALDSQAVSSKVPAAPDAELASDGRQREKVGLSDRAAESNHEALPSKSLSSSNRVVPALEASSANAASPSSPMLSGDSGASTVQAGSGGPEAPNSTLKAELALIRGAQTALRSKDPTRALQLVGTHEARFPKGVLTEERLAAKALAQCQLGQMGAARGTIEKFRLASSQSPLWDRVAQECGIEK